MPETKQPNAGRQAGNKERLGNVIILPVKSSRNTFRPIGELAAQAISALLARSISLEG